MYLEVRINLEIMKLTGGNTSSGRGKYWRSSSVTPCRKTIQRERQGRRRERLRIGGWKYGVKRNNNNNNSNNNNVLRVTK